MTECWHEHTYVIGTVPYPNLVHPEVHMTPQEMFEQVLSLLFQPSNPWTIKAIGPSVIVMAFDHDGTQARWIWQREVH